MKSSAKILFVGLFFLVSLLATSAQAAEKAVLYLIGTNLQVGPITDFAFSGNSHSFSGKSLQSFDDKSKTGDSGSSKTQLSFQGTWNPDAGTVEGSMSGTIERKSTYHDGTKGSASATITGKLSGKVSAKSRAGGTVEITYNNSKNEGTISKVPVSGTKESGTFTLDLFDPSFAFTSNALKEETLKGSISNLVGDVEISKDAGKTWKALTKGVSIEKGDLVSTSFDSTATIQFAHGNFNIAPMTQIRVDEFLNKDNLERAQLYMNVGRISARIDKPANIRADFSVTTPTASASVRGSGMTIATDEKYGTTIYATDGITYYTIGNTGEQTLSTGKKLNIDLSGKITTGEYRPEEIGTGTIDTKVPTKQSSPSWIWYLIAAIAIVSGVILAKRRKQTIAN